MQSITPFRAGAKKYHPKSGYGVCTIRKGDGLQDPGGFVAKVTEITKLSFPPAGPGGSLKAEFTGMGVLDYKAEDVYDHDIVVFGFVWDGGPAGEPDRFAIEVHDGDDILMFEYDSAGYDFISGDILIRIGS
jgi:hypothetical protein